MAGEHLSTVRVGEAIELAHEFDELAVSLTPDESLPYLREAIQDQDLTTAFYTRDLMGAMALALDQIKERRQFSPEEIRNKGLVYSETASNELLGNSSTSEVLAITARSTIPQLLRKLPRHDKEVLTEEDNCYDNAKDFVALWRKKSRQFDTRGKLGLPKLKRSTFLPEEVAVDILIEMGFIPADAQEVGITILKNSVPKYDTDYGKDIVASRLYDICPASRSGIDGYILRTFSRGL